MAERLSKFRRRSGASFRAKLLEPFPVFIDRSLGKLAVATRIAAEHGVVVYLHDDHFKPDEEDVVWVPEVARRGWVILTKDKNIRRRHLEIQAVIEHAATMFTMRGGEFTGAEMGEAFARAIPKMRRLAARYFPPLVGVVSRGGEVEVL